jgi:hypothetical protein
MEPWMLYFILNNDGAMRVTMLITLHNENAKLKKMCGIDVQKKYIEEE